MWTGRLSDTHFLKCYNEIVRSRKPSPYIQQRHLVSQVSSQIKHTSGIGNGLAEAMGVRGIASHMEAEGFQKHVQGSDAILTALNVGIMAYNFYNRTGAPAPKVLS